MSKGKKRTSGGVAAAILFGFVLLWLTAKELGAREIKSHTTVNSWRAGSTGCDVVVFGTMGHCPRSYYDNTFYATGFSMLAHRMSRGGVWGLHQVSYNDSNPDHSVETARTHLQATRDHS